MARRIVLLQGHPDPDPARFGHALADAYARGAADAGHELRRIELGRLDFPLLRSAGDWQRPQPPAALAAAQADLAWAGHIVVFFPLWMGMPALVYRWYFRAHSLRSLERNILRFCGVRPVHETLIGSVEGSAARRRRWLAKLEALGRRGS